MIDYPKLGTDLGTLLEQKNAAYGNSFQTAGQILAILFPSGIPVHRYGDALAMVRVLDKLSRVATDRDAFGEDPWMDVAGYGLLMAAGKK